MKRMICIIMLLSLFLSGCSVFGERIKDPVVFYYIQKDYQHDMETVIASEIREASGHRNDLSYLLALYSMGPSTEELRLPLPKGTTITPVEHSQGRIVLALSDTAQNMTDVEYTLVSACLTMTCMELTDIPAITVVCGDRSVTMNADNLLLQDPAQLIQSEESK